MMKRVAAKDEGEDMMQQSDSIQILSKGAILFNWVIRFFDSSRSSTSQSDPIKSNIDRAESDPETEQPYRGSQPVSGGYNEAFIVQYWTSYHLR
jgi:hypothetical protein